MTKHGKHKKRRPGVHKNARSPETLYYEREHLIPECPAWMPDETYRKLAGMRAVLEGVRKS